MADQLHVEIVSPAGSVFRGDAEAVIAPGVMGSFEVLKDHAPLIAAINVGTLVVRNKSGNPIEFATSGGFVEVLDNTVTVLAETAEPVDAIDVDRAKKAEARAMERLADASGEEKEKATADLERARNRLRAAMSSVGGKN